MFTIEYQIYGPEMASIKLNVSKKHGFYDIYLKLMFKSNSLTGMFSYVYIDLQA